MSLALVDGDLVAFRAAAAAQENVDWGDGEETPICRLDTAKESAVSLIRKWAEQAGCDRIRVCFSDREGRNFRRRIHDYKLNRGPKPLAYWPVVEEIEKTFDHWRIAWLEADDVMGIMASSPKLIGSVVVTTDKDLMGVPCYVFDPVKMDKPMRVSLEDADRWWMRQTLTGDPTDGYKGCPGIGPVKADKILSGARKLDEMWRRVVETYVAKGLDGPDVLAQARLARILRREDYDPNKETIRLWHPKPDRREVVHLNSLVSPAASPVENPRRASTSSNDTATPSPSLRTA